MPTFTTGDIRADVSRKIHGSVSASFYGSLGEAARWLLNAIDPYETKRKTTIESALYDQVDKYYLPVDLKDNKIIDMRRQVFNERTYRDDFAYVGNRTFDKYNSTGKGQGAWRTYTIETEDNIKYIRMNDRLPNDTLLINQTDNLTNNGTWNTYGSITNLTVDQLNYR